MKQVRAYLKAETSRWGEATAVLGFDIHEGFEKPGFRADYGDLTADDIISAGRDGYRGMDALHVAAVRRGLIAAPRAVARATACPPQLPHSRSRGVSRAPRGRRVVARSGSRGDPPRSEDPEPPGLALEALAARVRAVVADPKRTPSMRGPEGWLPWLEELAGRGILVYENGWKPTRAGGAWLRSLALTFPEREQVAA